MGSESPWLWDWKEPHTISWLSVLTSEASSRALNGNLMRDMAQPAERSPPCPEPFSFPSAFRCQAPTCCLCPLADYGCPGCFCSQWPRRASHITYSIMSKLTSLAPFPQGTALCSPLALNNKFSANLLIFNDDLMGYYGTCPKSFSIIVRKQALWLRTPHF